MDAIEFPDELAEWFGEKFTTRIAALDVFRAILIAQKDFSLHLVQGLFASRGFQLSDQEMLEIKKESWYNPNSIPVSDVQREFSPFRVDKAGHIKMTKKGLIYSLPMGAMSITKWTLDDMARKLSRVLIPSRQIELLEIRDFFFSPVAFTPDVEQLLVQIATIPDEGGVLPAANFGYNDARVDTPFKARVVIGFPSKMTETREGMPAVVRPLMQRLGAAQVFWQWMLPWEYVDALLQREHSKESPNLLANFWLWQRQFRARMFEAKAPTFAYTMALSDVPMAQIEATGSTDPQVRVEALSNTPLYVPTFGTERIYSKLREIVGDSSELHIAHKGDELGKTWRNQVLGFDEENKSLVFINGSNNVEYFDLMAGTQLPNLFIRNLGMNTVVDPWLPPEILNYWKSLLHATDLSPKISQWEKDRWVRRLDEFGLPSGSTERHSKSLMEWIQTHPYIGEIRAILDEVWEKRNDPEVYHTQTVSDFLVLMGYVYLFRLMAHEDLWDQVLGNASKEQQAVTATTNEKLMPNRDYKVPLVQGLKLQPHQLRALSRIAHFPSDIALQMDAGGGKTITILVYMLALMRAGKARKPLIACPGHLLKNYVEEMEFITEGRGRIVPFSTETVNTHGLDELLARAREPHAIIVTDYNWIVGKTEEFPYFDDWISRSSNLLLLKRELGVDAVAADESHYLKNAGSGRSDAFCQLIDSAKYRLIASGTMISDNLLDFISQVGMLVPTIFGSPESFAATHAAGIQGNNVTRWKVGTGGFVVRSAMENMAYLSVKKKEWAHLLPLISEQIHIGALTTDQQDVYKAILKSTLEEIRVNNPKLWAMLIEGNPDQEAKVMNMLTPYLQRLERFVTAPTSDDLGKKLKGKDAQSPSLLLVIKQIEEHFKKKIPGKIMILTNSILSAESLYEHLPKHLKELAVHYTAGNKHSCLTAFKSEGKKILVGVEQSLREGLNLQFTSRVILTEMPWSPGHIEQIVARYRRPELKEIDDRTGVHLDILLCDGTISITKFARLTSKIVSKVSIDEWNNPKFKDMPELDKVSMTLSSIEEFSTVDSVMGHYTAYSMLRKLEEQEFMSWKDKLHGINPLIRIADGQARKNDWEYPQTWVAGFVPPEAKRLKLKCAVTLDNDDLSEAKAMCEFGKGTIKRVNKHSVGVSVKGIVYSVSKDKVWVKV